MWAILLLLVLGQGPNSEVKTAQRQFPALVTRTAAVDGIRTLIVHHEDSTAHSHKVIFWFHGMGGFHGFAANMYPQAMKLAQRHISFTIVEPEMPWSVYAKHPDGRRPWANGGFKRYAEAALATIPKTHNPRLIYVAGHSRGGKGIAYAAAQGGLCEMPIAGVLWSDATYGDWFKKAWSACLKNMPSKVEVLYLRRTETAGFLSAAQQDPEFHKVKQASFSFPWWYHGKIGDNALTLSRLTGEP